VETYFACALLDAIRLAVPVLVEAEWLVMSRLGPRAFDAVYDDIVAGSLQLLDLSLAQWRRVRELCDRYADLPLGLVDASVVATAEALEEPAIATLDHRHFTVVRPRHVPALELLPP
jgi:uncharacterized protein